LEKQYSEINFKDLGVIELEECLKIQEKLTSKQENFLLFATHYPIFSVGIKEAKDFPFATPVERDGSICYFDEGILNIYFIFNTCSKAFFYKKLKKILDSFFTTINFKAQFKKNPLGYYIKDSKIASIDFTINNCRTNHGISLHVNPNLSAFNQIRPCNIKNITATSLNNEGVKFSINEIKKILKPIIISTFKGNT